MSPEAPHILVPPRCGIPSQFPVRVTVTMVCASNLTTLGRCREISCARPPQAQHIHAASCILAAATDASCIHAAAAATPEPCNQQEI
ncbi:hypothetical protein E2C01_100119 [Portunus trituberculatus]|uniref:Uncharacterized protein n=1 Tax=Portunus trituberculatus TaxID=210409 RepID=A0A5B7K780_PORTR|nr:hypothetical protein [Portunus trituberculatus]